MGVWPNWPSSTQYGLQSGQRRPVWKCTDVMIDFEVGFELDFKVDFRVDFGVDFEIDLQVDFG